MISVNARSRRKQGNRLNVGGVGLPVLNVFGSMEIKSIRIITNIITYGPEPALSDEVEQRLTISSSGRVWFSARNYGQYQDGKGFFRKKQLNIGIWKAEYLLRLLVKLPEELMVTDCGGYEIVARYSDGSITRRSGPLIGMEGTAKGSDATSLTRLLRRYIPIRSLWGLCGTLSPDYEGKAAIFWFAKRWEERFLSGNLTDRVFEERFGAECAALGFQMDCGQEFDRLYPRCFGIKDGTLAETIASIGDVDLLGSAVYSQWRFLTHWSYSYELDQDTCRWFGLILRQMRELTRKQ